MTPAQIYVIRVNKTPTVGRPIAASHSYITWPISIFVDELLTIKIHMPSVLGDSSELIQFVENTGNKFNDSDSKLRPALLSTDWV